MKWLLLLLFLIMVGTLKAQYLVNEDFEGTGVPSGWYSGSTGDWDYTAVPLSGSQSGRCAAGQFLLYNGVALNNAEIWFKLLFKAETLPASTEPLMDIYDPTQSNVVYEILLNPAGTLDVEPSATSPTTVSALSAGTIYNIWGHYKSVSSNNSIIEVSFDVAGNPRPNSGNNFASATNAQFAQNAGLIFLGRGSTTTAMVFDNVQVASTDIFAGGGASPTPTPMGSNRFFLFPQ